MDENQSAPRTPAQSNAEPAQPLTQPNAQPVAQQADLAAIAQPTELTGVQKFAWLVVGLCVGLIPGVLIASLTNIGKPYRSDCTKFALIGGIITYVVAFLVIGAVLGTVAVLGLMEA